MTCWWQQRLHKIVKWSGFFLFTERSFLLQCFFFPVSPPPNMFVKKLTRTFGKDAYFLTRPSWGWVPSGLDAEYFGTKYTNFLHQRQTNLIVSSNSVCQSVCQMVPLLSSPPSSTSPLRHQNAGNFLLGSVFGFILFAPRISIITKIVNFFFSWPLRPFIETRGTHEQTLG